MSIWVEAPAQIAKKNSNINNDDIGESRNTREHEPLKYAKYIRNSLERNRKMGVQFGEGREVKRSVGGSDNTDLLNKGYKHS